MTHTDRIKDLTDPRYALNTEIGHIAGVERLETIAAQHMALERLMESVFRTRNPWAKR